MNVCLFRVPKRQYIPSGHASLCPLGFFLDTDKYILSQTGSFIRQAEEDNEGGPSKQDSDVLSVEYTCVKDTWGTSMCAHKEKKKRRSC